MPGTDHNDCGVNSRPNPVVLVGLVHALGACLLRRQVQQRYNSRHGAIEGTALSIVALTLSAVITTPQATPTTPIHSPIFLRVLFAFVEQTTLNSDKI